MFQAVKVQITKVQAIALQTWKNVPLPALLVRTKFHPLLSWLVLDVTEFPEHK